MSTESAVEVGAGAGRTVVPLHRVKFAENGPPRRSTLYNGTPMWLVTRYEDVRTVLTDSRFKRSLLCAPDAPALTDTPNLLNDPSAMFNQDDAQHLRVRRTLQRVFAPSGVRRMHPWISHAVDRTLDDLVAGGPPADLIGEYTLLVPLAVMNRMLGVEALENDRLRRWSEHAFANATKSAEEVAAVMAELSAFGAELIAERRRTPQDDLVSSMVRIADEEGGVPEEQLVMLIGALVVGGHESTMTMIGNCLLYLLGERREVWARLGSDEAAAEALSTRLMHLLPLGDTDEHTGMLRRAAEDVELSGVLIKAGEVVAASDAANRDPEAFSSDPFRDLFAPLESPTLAFGAGQHFCLGTWMARTEVRLALHRLAARLPDLRLTIPPDAVEWRLGTITRSPLRLPVTW